MKDLLSRVQAGEVVSVQEFAAVALLPVLRMSSVLAALSAVAPSPEVAELERLTGALVVALVPLVSADALPSPEGPLVGS